LAAVDTTAALAEVGQIQDPGSAAISLAWIARYAEEQLVQPIVADALASARRLDDPADLVVTASWPVRALVERSHQSSIPSIVEELLDRAKRVMAPPRRSQALFVLFEAVFPAGRAYWQDVYMALKQVSDPSHQWRQGANLRHAICLIANEDAGLAEDLARDVADERTRAKTERALARRDFSEGRLFFWPLYPPKKHRKHQAERHG
jgi:hypothetical protein